MKPLLSSDRWRFRSLIWVVILLGFHHPAFGSGCLELDGRWSDGPIYVAAVSGNLAVYSRGVSIEVADISQPSNPVILGSVEIEGSAVEISLTGNLAFVAADREGLFVIDFSDPTQPAAVGHWGGPTDHALDVASSGDHVFIANWGLVVLDVSVPGAPVEVAREPSGAITQLELVGNHVYGINLSSLVVWDVVDPTEPAVVFDEFGDYKTHLAANEQRLLTTDAGRLSIFTLDNPAAPEFVTEYHDPAASFRRLTVDGTHAYLVTTDDELAIVDTTDPANPSTDSIWPSPGDPLKVRVTGSTAFLTAREGGLRILDVSDSFHPTEVGALSAVGASIHIAVSGDVAFVAQSRSGLRIFDVTDSDEPAELSFLPLTGAEGVDVDGARAVVAGGDAGIFVVDVSNPSSPSLLGHADTPGEAWKAEVAGDLVYVADGESGLTVFDISVPSAISLVGQMPTMHRAMDVTLAGHLAYLADSCWGLAVVDVSDPAKPVKVYGDSSWENYCAQSVVVGDGIAVLVEGWNAINGNRLEIYDVSNPTAPLLINEFDRTHILWVGWDLAIDGDVLYVAYEREAVALDLRNPLEPAFISRDSIPGFATGISTADGRVFVAANNGGIATAGSSVCPDMVFADGWDDYDWYGYTVWSNVEP